MTDAFANRDKLALGRAIGQPAANPAAGTVPSVVIVEGVTPMAGTKADRNGVYELNGARYRIAAGDPLPDGAAMVAGERTVRPMAGDGNAPKADDGELVTSEKATAKKAKGPSETAEGSGPSETA